MKTQTTTNSIPLYGGVVGFVIGLLASIVFGFLAVREIDSSFIVFGIFTGPLGAIVGAYIAVFWKTTGKERKKLTVSLLPILGGVVGFILGFWIPAVTIFRMVIRETFEMAVPGIFFGAIAGFVIAPFSAIGGIYMAKQLLKASSKEEGSV